MRLTLRDVGLPYQKIMQGKKWIGRVYRAADGKWACDIFKERQYSGGATPLEAFQEGGARYMGYTSSQQLSDANSIARRQRAADRAEVKALARDMLSHNKQTRDAAFDRLFNGIFKERS